MNQSVVDAQTDKQDTNSKSKSWTEAMKAYFDHRALFLLFLGFASGMPILLVYANIGLWLSEAGHKLSVVTMFSWAALGYSFKFIWAPLIDALPVPILHKWLGRRRAWMLVSQIGVIGAIFLIANTDPILTSPMFSVFGCEIMPLVVMALGAVLLGFASATQDIVIDAYRIDVAPTSLQPILSSTYIIGYRIGMIVAGAGALYLADYFGSTKELYSYEAWRDTYYILAGVFLVAILTTLTVYEPNTKIISQKKQTINQTIMGCYAVALLIPGTIYGAWHIFNKLYKICGSNERCSNIFGINTLNINTFDIPQSIMEIAVSYGKGLAIFIPLVLILLLVNQPRFEINNDSVKVIDDKNDYVRLVSVFFISVLSFVFTFKNLKGLLPDDINSKLISFIANSGVMVSSTAVALVIGTLLVNIGFVKKDVAMRVWINPILDFFKRYGKKAFLLLALIGLYRISDIVAGAISTIFYQDMNFTKTQIADSVKFVGLLMAILGGFLGGLLTQKISIMKAMMAGAVMASMTNLLFILLSFHKGEEMYLYFAVIIDNLAAGLASAIFVAFLSALTSIRFSAVQYAIFSSLMTLIPKILGGYSGTIVESEGYPVFFFFTFVIGLPILLLIYLTDKHIDIGEVPK